MHAQATVFVVDDDSSVRDALRCMLEAAGHRVETFASAEAFLAGYDPSRRGCLLLDVCMPGMDGLALQDRLVQQRVYLPIIVLTGHADVPMAVRALRAGAVDFVEKPFDEADLLRRIEEALIRSVQCTSSEAERAAIRERLAGLSQRERQVLDLLVAGKWVKAIAAELGTSPNTVKNQRASILEKMEAESVPDLVRMVLIARLSHEPPPG
jgi:RNA polymerase sigma factor (sigma-70 family)